MKISKKCFLHITLISIYIKYCACSCADQFDDSVLTYNECMDATNIKKMLQLSIETLGLKELCVMFDLSLKCTKAGRSELQNCTGWVETQMTNHVSGLKAYEEVECTNLEPDQKTEAEIVLCEMASQKGRQDCNRRFNYNHAMFLPMPVVELKFDKNLWTVTDCLLKFQWADCWIREYGKCKAQAARRYYGNLFVKILRAYPNCKKALGADLEKYKPGRATSPTTSCFLLLLLAIIHFNL